MSPGKRQKVHSPGRVQRPSFHRDSSKSWSVRSLPTTYAGARKDVKQGTPHESGSRTLWLVLLGLGLVSAFCFPATIYNHPIPLLLCPHAIPPSSTAHIHPNSSLLYIIWFYFRLLPRTVDATRRGSPIRSVTRRAYYVDHKTRSNTCIHRPGLSASIPAAPYPRRRDDLISELNQCRQHICRGALAPRTAAVFRRPSHSYDNVK